MRKILIIFITISLLGCGMSLINTTNISDDDRNYLDRASVFPFEFIISKDEDEGTWKRAQSYIGLYSSMKLQVATDTILETYNPVGVRFGYRVVKTPLPDDTFRISVTCTSGNMFAIRDAERNVRIFSMYIKTGELPQQFIAR